MASDDAAPGRRIPWKWIQRVAVLIGLAGLMFRLREIGADDWGQVRTIATHQLVPVIVVLALSVGLRLRSTLQVVASVLAGFFTATWLAYHGGGWLIDVMGADSPLRLTLGVPVMEESAKAVLVAFVAWNWRRGPASPGVVDMGLAGMAVGAGFAWHEDLLWDRVSSSGFVEGAGFVMPSVHTATGVVAGHMVWTGLVGLALGVLLIRRTRWSWMLAGAALLLTVVDHGTWNDAAVRESVGLFLADGWLAVALFAGGLVAAFVVDTRRVRLIPASRRIVPGDVVRYVSGGSAASPLRRWMVASEVMRFTTGATHALARRGPPSSADPEPEAAAPPTGTGA